MTGKPSADIQARSPVAALAWPMNAEQLLYQRPETVTH
jgi:hypothetical protein